MDLVGKLIRIVQQVRRPSGLPLEIGPLKTTRSRRTLPLPDPLVQALRAHKVRQEAEKAFVGADTWGDKDFVFPTQIGTPTDPRNDYREFKKLLAKDGLPDAQLHDLRHTAASLLLPQGVHPRVLMELLGHSQIALTMNLYTSCRRCWRARWRR